MSDATDGKALRELKEYFEQMAKVADSMPEHKAYAHAAEMCEAAIMKEDGKGNATVATALRKAFEGLPVGTAGQVLRRRDCTWVTLGPNGELTGAEDER